MLFVLRTCNLGKLGQGGHDIMGPMETHGVVEAGHANENTRLL
jgi:hypothetical protein